MFESCKEAISKWDSNDDIYAAGILVLNDDDDLRKPTLRLVYNTYTQSKSKFPTSMNEGNHKLDVAISELEAMWNFPFWLWRIHAAICTDSIAFDGDVIDYQGISLRNEWIKSLGLWYDDKFEENNFEDSLELGGQIGRYFDELCVNVAKDLHKIIDGKFGRDIPIIFFNREGTAPEAIEMTLAANDLKTLNGFADYIKEYCGY
jgi:hypothetical protein